MNILFLAPEPFFRVRGTPINVRHVVTALAEAGHRVDLLCYPFGETVPLPEGVRVIRSPRPPCVRDVGVGFSPAKLMLDFFFFWKALGLFLRTRYDVVHAVEESAFLALPLLALRRARFIFDMDSLLSDQLRYGERGGPLLARTAAALERRAMRRADFVLTVCQSLSDEVHARAPGARVVQIEDAPIGPSAQEDAEGAARLRQELNLGCAPAVVYTGNFERYQGIDLLLRAARTVLEQRPDVRFVLVGGEPAHVAHAQELAADLDLGEGCLFTGLRPMEEMAAFMTFSSILVSPRTRGTNTALKLYTYMQSGRPIVATRLPTHTQVLDETCAVLVQPQAEDFAAGILGLLEDPERGEALAREARARVATRYSLAAFNHKVRQAYQDLERH